MPTTHASSTELREKIAHEIKINPAQFTGALARRHGVTEMEVLRAHPPELCTELDPARIEEIIRALESLGTVMVICSNEAAILEANGKFGGFSKSMGFFNILTDTLDMHLRLDNIRWAFAHIKKPHVGGEITHSIQFYSHQGTPCFKVFVLDYLAKQSNENHEEQVAAWDSIRAEFRQPAAE